MTPTTTPGSTEVRCCREFLTFKRENLNLLEKLKRACQKLLARPLVVVGIPNGC